jgi:protoporphyrinogen oxidase
MRIAIVGGGFTGLAAGLELVKAGHKVVVFEKEKKVGGLAGNFNPTGWKWGLEKYYHHIFSGDNEIIKLAKDVGWPAFFEKPVTNSLLEEEEQRLDSPLSLLMFRSLSLISRLHMGVGLLGLKVVKNGLWLERYRVADVLPKLVGKEGYKKVWEPLLVAKFGKYLPRVNMAWFWARVNKRTSSLGYFKGGFGKLAEKIAEEIKKNGGEIKLDAMYKNKKGFDNVLDTTPAIGAVDYLWGQTLVLELDRKLMNGYWLNVLEKDWPFLVVVEQTNFVDKKYYGSKQVVYFGNYLENKDKRLKMSDEELLELYLPYIKKINPGFGKEWITRKWKFQNNYAQPVFPINYSRQLPEIRTKVPGVYVANMSMVYPWDRGVNFAVELGQGAARVIMNDVSDDK